jgi:thiol-disulfide isomerase/thioredoxin
MIAYDKLAEELKDKVNIVAVDCDSHRALCTSNGVKGFPTIKMYVHNLDSADDRLENGKSNEYSGSRSLDKLKEFALKSVKP